MFAVTNKKYIGVDIESYRESSRKSEDRLLNLIRSNRDVQSIDAVTMWTLKESVLKMLGCGLSIPMREVHIYDETEGTYYVKFRTKEISCIHATISGLSVSIAHMTEYGKPTLNLLIRRPKMELENSVYASRTAW